MKKQNVCAAPAGTLSRRCRCAKQLTVIVLSVLAACVMFAVQVSAAEINPANFIAVTGKVLRALIIMVGAGLAVFGVINLLEGYGSDNAANKSQVSSRPWQAPLSLWRACCSCQCSQV